MPAAITLGTAAALAGAALIVLLTVIWPRLNGARPGDELPSHRSLRAADGTKALHDWLDNELKMTSALAAAKYHRVRTAIVLLITAVILLAVSVPLIVID